MCSQRCSDIPQTTGVFTSLSLPKTYYWADTRTSSFLTKVFISHSRKTGEAPWLAGWLPNPSLPPRPTSIQVGNCRDTGVHSPQGKRRKTRGIISFPHDSQSDHFTSNCPQLFSRNRRLLWLKWELLAPGFLFLGILWQLCNLLFSSLMYTIYQILLSSIQSTRSLLTSKCCGIITFITHVSRSPMEASNLWRDDQKEKRLIHIHYDFNINTLLFFGPFKIGMPSLVYVIILLTRIPQMEKRAEYIENTLHKSLLEN